MLGLRLAILVQGCCNVWLMLQVSCVTRRLSESGLQTRWDLSMSGRALCSSILIWQIIISSSAQDLTFQ